MPADAPPSPSTLRRWMTPDTRSRRVLLALGVYVGCLIVYALIAGDRLLGHTPYNHYAHLADAWLHGRQDLRFGAPGYAMGNDFAHFEGKTFISFPPFPALLMLPFVWLSGTPEDFRDGQFIVWLAGIGPAALFLALEKLRRTGRSARSERDNLFLALFFAFGTVYFFTAVQGTVWFAAHVVGVGLIALYVLYALDADRPWVAGLLMACMFMTRPTTLLLGLLFVAEALRASYIQPAKAEGDATPGDAPAADAPAADTRAWVDRFDRARLTRTLVSFGAPVVCAMLIASYMNGTRFHEWSPTAFGHEHLSVAWQARIKKWGLFGPHFLPKNLGAMLTILPWLPPKGGSHPGGVPFLVNGHGLALWFTTPIYLWVLWPKRGGLFYGVVAVTAALPAVMNLMYQNSGWFQFGYRFSNDYAVLLFVLLAVGARSLGRTFWLAALWGIGWNLFGAVTFERSEHRAFYVQDGSQTLVYQPD
ncbi:MAG: DUF2029 domain-containing protein [Myxococcales bacterium]|nr:DUF2029 domain-containing protein [Myxococcales bacterium]